ncbi:hypothetical protein [Microcoleus sp.]|uniref:hypothetical protein n=1 Tax=Microcoleus sp. TaxID=44472 RepID=UPI00352526FF
MLGFHSAGSESDRATVAKLEIGDDSLFMKYTRQAIDRRRETALPCLLSLLTWNLL